jgi:hypothetical protein
MAVAFTQPDSRGKLLERSRRRPHNQRVASLTSQPAAMPTEPSGSLDSILERFEDAWNTAPPEPRVEDFLPPDYSHSVALLAELVLIDLERRLKRGEDVRVERDYLSRFPELAVAPEHAIAIVGEYERAACKPDLSSDEFLARFRSTANNSPRAVVRAAVQTTVPNLPGVALPPGAA